ncbi:MAG: aminopeptidase [Thermoplasmata archaeon]|nr:aminopeptidase [Thermoplasmata archaeon]
MPRPRRSDTPERLFARHILAHNLKVRAGERVTIDAWTHALPWASALAREARRMGAFPLVLYNDEAGFWDSVEGGETKVLGSLAKHERAALKRTDVYLYLWGPGDRVRLGKLAPAASEEVFAFNEDWYKVARKNGVRGARLEVARPFPSLAKAYGVQEEAWRRQIVEASLVPPGDLKKAGQRLAKRLEEGRDLHLTHPNGTDLSLRLAGRVPRVNWGVVDAEARKRPYGLMGNLPSGQVVVALDEKRADGKLFANRASYYDHSKATGAEFTFKSGRLVRAEFDSGGELFRTPYEDAGKGRDRPGILSIGLNPKLKDTPQVEDLERGAVLVSVGANAYLGGANSSDFFGWAVVGEGRLELDGEPLVDGGAIS